ncbi:hypothetical protein O4H66_00520 [Comamonadaceae bacterium G21597-S1]|nr:hypothetical protein [Comamonadaceae bacterium G21597-S1]
MASRGRICGGHAIGIDWPRVIAEPVHSMSADPKTVITWVLVLVVPFAATAILAGFLTRIPYDVQLQIVQDHFAAIVGLPVAAIFSAFLVVVLQQTSGPVRFEGLGFKFEGTSGQVVLWVFCFLAITVAIRLLWRA